MLNKAKRSDKVTRKRATHVFGARVILPVVGLVASIIAFAVWVVVFSAEQSDNAAIKRDASAVGSALQTVIDRMPQEQRSVFVADEAYKKIVLNFNPQWIHNNIGRQLHAIHGHDIVAIVSANNRPLYLMSGGKKRPAMGFEAIRGDIAHLIADLQRSYRRQMVRQPRRAHSALKSLNPNRSNHLVSNIHVMDIVKIGRRIAIAGVMAVSRAGGQHVVDLRSSPMVISIKYLDLQVLAGIADNAVVEKLSITDEVKHPGDNKKIGQITLQNRRGADLGALHWKSDLPGTVLANRATPLVVLSVFTLLGLTFFILLAARRAAAEIEASESKVRYESLHDSLTSLPNRTYFKKRMSRALDLVKASDVRIGCAVIDLNAFMEVNNTFGHKVGDALIKEVAGRLRRMFDADAFIARTGGDEFAILRHKIRDSGEMSAFCRRIEEVFKMPFFVDGIQISESACIGFTIGRDDGDNPEDILRRADLALHQAKKSSDRNIVQFTQALEDRINERQILVDDLRNALAHNDLYLHYQPLISSDDLKICGVEALLRWHHPRHGNIPPDVFIPIAEEFQLIDEIGRWVLNAACRDAVKWPDIPVAVNISPRHLCQSDFIAQVDAALTAHALAPSRLAIEVTESVVLEHEDVAHRVFDELRNAGIKVALDDFGTGYSSLSYLERFRFDKLKIDRAFLRNLETSLQAAAIVHTVVGLGDSLNMTIVAEGVETEAQRRFLQAAGCHQLQGYLFSKPVAANEITKRFFQAAGDAANSDAVSPERPSQVA